MTDDDKALVERLCDEDSYYSLQEKHWCIDHVELESLRLAAAHRIEAQEAEIEKLEKAIKVQASAVRTLQANEETEINVLRQQKREWHQAVSSLDSEREANAILTAEIEKLREALDLFGGEKAIEARALFDRMKVARKGTRERKSLAKRHYEAAHLARAARAALGETK